MDIPLPVQIEYKRALPATKTCSRKQFAPAFALAPALRGRLRAFTLVEMLVVLGMIVILLSVIVPAVTSLSKANGRKAAMANLLGGIEQARAEAIKSGQAAYVVFPTFTSGAQSLIKNAQDRIVARRDQRSHVKAVPNESTTAVDGAFAAHLSAVAIKWRDTDQSCDFTTIELPEFRQLGQE